MKTLDETITLFDFVGCTVRASAIVGVTSVYVNPYDGCFEFKVLLLGGHELAHSGKVGEPQEKTEAERQKVLDTWRRLR
jgi:hypothetical protein